MASLGLGRGLGVLLGLQLVDRLLDHLGVGQQIGVHAVVERLSSALPQPARARAPAAQRGQRSGEKDIGSGAPGVRLSA